MENHKCYVKKEKKKRKEKVHSHYIFFDFEARVEPVTGIHEVNLAVAKKVCMICMNEPFFLT